MNNDLELIYLQSLEAETKHLMKTYHQFVDRARDKQLGTGVIGGLFVLQQKINYAGALSKKISEQFDNGYRLGMPVSQIISEMKPGIESFRTEVTNFRKKMKRRVTGVKLHWRKNRLGIPVGLEHIQLKMSTPDDPYGATGSFFDALSDAAIAYELGKMKALDQVVSMVRKQYVALGGVVADFAKQSQQLNERYLLLGNALRNDDISTFISALKTLFAALPFHLDKYESTYHNIIHTIIDVLGFDIVSELPTNNGRIDAVIKLEKTIYVI